MFRFVSPVCTVLLAAATTAQATCNSTLSGTSCGPTLSVVFVPQGQGGGNDLTLTASGLHPNSFGIMVWGTIPLNVPLGNCPMLTDFLWGHFVQIDSQGSHSWSRNWPGSAIGGFLIQFGSFVPDALGNLDILTTDCKYAYCQ